MATAIHNTTTAHNNLAKKVLNKAWREVSRPFRRRQRRPATIATTSVASGFQTFHPSQCTVEEAALPLLKKLVLESRQYPGPIIEIGTLMGITATHMALEKAPWQKIITVDNYCWNPWGLPPDNHYALAAQVLFYLKQSGQVEQVRMDKAEFFASYHGPAPSLVFLDAWHTYEETKKDIEWAKSAGAKIISGHDYCSAFPGVVQVVHEFGGPRELGASVWVLN